MPRGPWLVVGVIFLALGVGAASCRILLWLGRNERTKESENVFLRNAALLEGLLLAIALIYAIARWLSG